MTFLSSAFNSSDSGVFIRQAQLIVGALTESQGGGDTQQAIIFKSSGKQDDFRISFRIVKNITSLGIPNSMEVTLYNLTKETKQFLSKKATNITLELGYEQSNKGRGKLQKVATGGLASVVPARQGPTITTTLFLYDGQDGLARAVSYKAYKGSITLNRIVQDLADDIPGVVSSGDNILLENSVYIGPKGQILAGRTKSLLDNLASQFAFNWHIQDGIFKAIRDDFIDGNTFEISTESSNLINVSPRIDNVGQVATTIDIETILDPRIKPGDIVDLKSTVNPTLNHKYQVTFVSHIGDTHGDVWQTNIQCVLNEVFKQFLPTSANSPAAPNAGPQV